MCGWSIFKKAKRGGLELTDNNNKIQIEQKKAPKCLFAPVSGGLGGSQAAQEYLVQP